MQLDFLANHPHFIPTLAAWHQAMWGHLDTSFTLQDRIARLTSHTGCPAIPTTVVAFVADEPMGSASLVVNDLRTHPHLSPFLASVYVAEPYRRRGIAAALVQRVMQDAWTMGVTRLYLITPDQQALYGRLGWQRIEEVTYRGETDTLMAVEAAYSTTSSSTMA